MIVPVIWIWQANTRSGRGGIFGNAESPGSANDKIGVAWKNADGSLRSADELLPEIADGLNNLTNEAERTQVMMQLLGRSGVELAPLMKAGAKGIEELREEADKLGRTWTETAADNAAEYVDAQNRIKSALTGLKNILGQAIIPLFSEVADKISEWVAANQPLIRQISEIIGLLSKESKDFVRLADIGAERIKVEEQLAEFENEFAQL